MANYKNGGCEKKYTISKANGNPTDPKADYFVLRLDKDPHALRALAEYANSVKKDNPKLALDLWKKINEYGDDNLFDKTSDESDVCSCAVPYFPTGNTAYCSKCNKPTPY